MTAGDQTVKPVGLVGESRRVPPPPGFEPVVGRDQTEVPGRSRRHSPYLYRVVAAELSRFTRYFDRLVQWQPAPHDPLVLFDAIDCPDKSVACTLDDLPDFSCDREQRAVDARHRGLKLRDQRIGHASDSLRFAAWGVTG